MAKPIFLIGLPLTAPILYPQQVYENLNDKIKEDYHVIVYLGKSVDMKFEVFYEKDFTDVKFEELKEIVKNSLKTPQQMSFAEWSEVNEDLINCELAENGADREMDFDSEKEFEKRYEKYLNNEI